MRSGYDSEHCHQNLASQLSTSVAMNRTFFGSLEAGLLDRTLARASTPTE
jgi:hypothetical protein